MARRTLKITVLIWLACLLTGSAFYFFATLPDLHTAAAEGKVWAVRVRLWMGEDVSAGDGGRRGDIRQTCPGELGRMANLHPPLFRKDSPHDHLPMGGGQRHGGYRGADHQTENATANDHTHLIGGAGHCMQHNRYTPRNRHFRQAP